VHGHISHTRMQVSHRESVRCGRIASHRIASYRIASHRIVSYRIVSHRVASSRTRVSSIPFVDLVPAMIATMSASPPRHDRRIVSPL